MPICPNCEYEYVEGVAYCPDCETKLVDENVYVKPEEWTEENWETAYTSSHEYEVQMLVDNLKSAGINAAMLSQKDHNFPAPGDFSIVKLIVHKKDLKAALTYIQDFLGNDDSGDEETD